MNTTHGTHRQAPRQPICKECIHHRPPWHVDPLANLPHIVSPKVVQELRDAAVHRLQDETDYLKSGMDFRHVPPEFYDWCEAHSADLERLDPISGERVRYYRACAIVNTQSNPCQLFEPADPP